MVSLTLLMSVMYIVNHFACRYIVQYASVKGGIVVSNDQYRDLLDEDPLMRETIENRLLMYNWVAGDTLMLPWDPLGRFGPNLDDFLYF